MIYLVRCLRPLLRETLHDGMARHLRVHLKRYPCTMSRALPPTQRDHAAECFVFRKGRECAMDHDQPAAIFHITLETAPYLIRPCGAVVVQHDGSVVIEIRRGLLPRIRTGCGEHGGGEAPGFL